MKLNKQRALQTHRHAMFALDVAQINWRKTVAHLPTEDSGWEIGAVRIFFTISLSHGRQFRSRPSDGSPADAATAALGVPGDRPLADPAVTPRYRACKSCPAVLPRRASCRRAKITVKGARCARVADAMARAPPLTLIFPGKDPAPIGEDGERWSDVYALVGSSAGDRRT
jgi:hypothetical protein